MRLAIKGEYPTDWKDIALRVKAEAGNRCVRCGHPDGDRMRNRTKEWSESDGIPYTKDVLRHIGHDPIEKDLVPCDRRCSHPKDGKLRALTVHHLDGDKSNCRWWNLLALCQACHLSVQARVIPERPFLWEHSEWFKPYAAGFYAFWHGDYDDYSDSRGKAHVLANLDRYLKLGQPWLYGEAE